MGSATAGLVLERTRLGGTLSAPLIATLLGLLWVNTGVMPSSAPAYQLVYDIFVPLAIPLLLFNADIRRILRETGRLLVAFVVGFFGTLFGTLVACAVVPLKSVGAEGIKAAVALNARHIGGSVNLVAVAEAVHMKPTTVAALLAADNIVLAVYFPLIFALSTSAVHMRSSELKSASAASTSSEAASADPRAPSDIRLIRLALALTVAVAACWTSQLLVQAWGIPSMFLPVLTLVIVALATLLPGPFRPLQSSGTALGMLLMQVFFVITGALGSIGSVVRTAPVLLLFSAVQVLAHLAFVLSVGPRLRLTRNEILLASNANVGGPTTAAGMAGSKGWLTLIVPAILIGVCGYATATFASLALVPILPKWIHCLPWTHRL